MASFNFGKWIPFGFKVVTMIPGIVGAVEAAVTGFKGPEKRAAAIELTKASIVTAEDLADKDLLNDPAVIDAVGGAIDAYVNVQNVISAVKHKKFAATKQ